MTHALGILRGLAAAAIVIASTPGDASTLIRDARVIDGSGRASRITDVRIDGDRIVAIGKLRRRPDERLVRGTGLALAPGFIDSHSHGDDALFERPDAGSFVSQGITTIVVGQDGFSRSPLRRFFADVEAKPAAVNLASFSGHNTLRAQVMGEDFKREASAAQIAAMSERLVDDMAAGALGLSTGLEYDPGIYSARSEILGLARIAAARGGSYISHIRSEDRQLWSALDEAIAIGRDARMPVQISHMKLAMVDWWGQAPRFVETLDRARAAGVDVAGDVYPYVNWHSNLTVMFPERRFDRDSARFALDHLAPAAGLVISEFGPDPMLVGKSIAEIARQRRQDPVDTLLAMIAESGGQASRATVIGTSMRDDDVRRLVAWPFASIASDGEIDGRHPRSAGTFTRILGRYVRDEKLLSLEEAVRRMTSLPAARMGFADRGAIRVGAFADLVLFDPAIVGDRATPEQPTARSVGIAMVWVNGDVVFQAGKPTGRHPGRVLRRKVVER